MPTTKPQTRSTARPSPKARAASLRAEAARVLPAPTFPDAPTDLADACDWAIRFWDWFNTGEGREGWPDARSDAELDRYDAVFARALAEPARDARTIAAKARLTRHDWLGHDPEDEHGADARHRLALAVLREASALAPPANDVDPALATLIAEHVALLRGANASGQGDIVSTELTTQAFDRFRRACAIPAATPADFRAKLGMILPELRQCVGDADGTAAAALDAIEADMPRVLSTATLPPVPADPPREPAGLPDPRAVAARIDMAAQSIHALRSFADVASAFAGIGYAFCCQPRCETPGDPGTLNAVGDFAAWIVAAAESVASAAQREARIRVVEPPYANARLSILTVPTIDDGDPAQMRALARDIEAEAARLTRG